MEKNVNDKKIGSEVEESILRDDPESYGGGGHGGASPEKDSRDYGKYIIIATLVVLASVAIVLAFI